MRRLVVLALAAASAAGFGCSDGAGPGPNVQLGVPSRRLSIPWDSVGALPDSTVVTLAGAAAAARWTATHGAGSWLTLVTDTGATGGRLRWERNADSLAGGTYVDTITVRLDGGAAAARLIDTLVVVERPLAFVTAKRAWLPGERDSTIASIVANGSLGQFSSLAPYILGNTDSVVYLVRNPLAPSARPSGLLLAPAYTSGWSVLGLDVHQVDTSHPPQAPSDTLDWLMTFWYNPSEKTHHGYVVAFSRSKTIGKTKVSTSSFDAAGGRSGAGGGEARKTVAGSPPVITWYYWEANGGNYWITSASYTGLYTIPAGSVWAGGTVSTGTMVGVVQSVTMPLVLPGANPAMDQTVNIDFRPTGIPASQIDCTFPSPCYGFAAAALADLQRGSSAAPGVPVRRARGLTASLLLDERP